MKTLALRLSTIALPLLASCSLMPEAPHLSFMNTHDDVQKAVAELAPTKGSEVNGQVRFTRQNGDTLVEVSLRNLSPGPHGFHIHERGDCSSPDALSAGVHFNPDDKPHGNLTSPHHAGDLGNVTASSDGTVNANFHVRDLRLSGEEGIVGRAVIVHAQADDFTTQPTGNSGKRLACGVINAQ